MNDEFEEILRGKVKVNEKLTIENIESYCNYRTIGPNYDLVTSVLSDKEKYMPIPANSKQNFDKIFYDKENDFGLFYQF